MGERMRKPDERAALLAKRDRRLNKLAEVRDLYRALRRCAALCRRFRKKHKKGCRCPVCTYFSPLRLEALLAGESARRLAACLKGEFGPLLDPKPSGKKAG